MQSATNSVKIICLHRITDEVDYAWPPMKVKVFKRLLEYVGKHFQVTSFADLQNATTSNSTKPKVILSFDDGYKDFYDNALPLLNEFGFPSNHNIICDTVFDGYINWTQEIFSIINYYLDKSVPLIVKNKEDVVIYEAMVNQKNAVRVGIVVLNKLFVLTKKERGIILNKLKANIEGALIYPEFMNEEEIRQCINRDVEIGSHTLSHCIIGGHEAADVLHQEMVTSKQQLEQTFQTNVDVFALPNGYYDKKTMNLLTANQTYKFVLTAEVEDFYFNKKEAVCAVPRISLYHNNHYFNVAKIHLIDQKVRNVKSGLTSLFSRN